jgi:hypothetical protein
MEVGLEKGSNDCNVRKQTAPSPRSKIEAILIVGEYVKVRLRSRFHCLLIGAMTEFCNDLRKVSCTSFNFYL